MPMTILVTRNVELRVRGFLASTMLEIAPGVYTSPNMTIAVRERVWSVLLKWRIGDRQDGALMTWPDSSSPGGQKILVLGDPPTELVAAGEVVLARRPYTEDEARSLTNQIEDPPF
jgi:CRISPR-associated protein Cas2